MSTAVKRGIYDKFGEEGLKGGIPLEFGSQTPWTTGYVFHGNPDKVFHEFFGGDNPFGGKRPHLPTCFIGKGCSCKRCFSLNPFVLFTLKIYIMHGKKEIIKEINFSLYSFSRSSHLLLTVYVSFQKISMHL